MPFARRLIRQPIAHDPEAGAETRAEFADLGPELASLLAGTAGCSPYLRQLMQREADWLRPALSEEPEAALAAELQAIGGDGVDRLSATLHRAKRRVALLTALADLGGVWPLEQVTGALTALADRAVATTLSLLVGEEIRRGRLPGQRQDDAATGAGMVVLAMGKMGAHELNYSSDIDLICLFDETRHPGTEQEARAAFIRITRRMAALLSDITADGYVFRTDLRLRPDAAVMPVCLSMAAAERYYEAEGRTWERAAYIKARPCAGDLAAGTRFLRALTPFVWRRHLDYAAIQDAHDMRLRIRDHRGLHGPVTVEGHNLKLGQGGIREIEFFAQTRQLIAGGRDPSLRDPTTTGALAALAQAGWLPPEVVAELTAAYRAHREIEHRLQMVGDAQTHVMPATAEGVARIAAFCGQPDVAAFRAGLLARIARVEDLTGGFFAPGQAPAGPEPSPEARAILERWTTYPALRSDRATAIFRRLRPTILHSLNRAANPQEALLSLDGFMAGLPAGVQLFSLFEANPQLVDLIVDIAATSPVLARHLARNSGVLDAVIGGAFFAPWPGKAALTADLQAVLARASDYEARLRAARVWMKETHFRVGVHHLRRLIGADEAGAAYADLAGAVVTALWPVVMAEVARRHGTLPESRGVLLAMGSLGAGRLHAGSDLDLIVIYDAPADAISDGPRPLGPRAWFARATQALVTALTAEMAEGRLYAVDMRLRPSGRQGPVATSLGAFCSYHETEAWTWEHLALTRARVVAGDARLGTEVEGFRRALLVQKGQGAGVRADVAAMRARLQAARPVVMEWEVRNGPGRLLDTDLLAQTAALVSGSAARMPGVQVQAGVDSGLLSVEDAATVGAAARLFWTMTCALRLLCDRPTAPEDLGEGGRAFVLRETGAQDAPALSRRIAATAAAAAAVIGETLG
jgi:[glutamine synthetase] adenylyltransferase / [glutamine synthetase]-adenylyl-L-tyrosine phosphorylase